MDIFNTHTNTHVHRTNVNLSHLVPQENIIDYSLGILSNCDNAFPFFAVLNCFFLLEIPAMYEI
jgi:hypothetical protein